MISVGRLLFRSVDIPFVGLSLYQHEIRERVYLETERNHDRLEVSNHHWIVCQEPFMIAVWANEASGFDAAQSRLLVTLDDMTVGRIKLKLTSQTGMVKGNLMLFTCTKSTSNHTTFVRRHLMLNYLRLRQKRSDAGNTSKFCVAYSYPRKVILISFRKDDYFNIFPMDFQGHIPETNQYLFGLRKTNRTLDQIVEQKRIVVCEVPASKKEIIYQLGKHHSMAPPSFDALSFDCPLSETFFFPVPDFTWAYAEIELHQFQSLGSHMLMIGNIVNHANKSAPDQQLHHIHSIHAVHRLRSTTGVK